jgi:hypothetical protein
MGCCDFGIMPLRGKSVNYLNIKYIIYFIIDKMYHIWLIRPHTNYNPGEGIPLWELCLPVAGY